MSQKAFYVTMLCWNMEISCCKLNPAVKTLDSGYDDWLHFIFRNCFIVQERVTFEGKKHVAGMFVWMHVVCSWCLCLFGYNYKVLLLILSCLGNAKVFVRTVPSQDAESLYSSAIYCSDRVMQDDRLKESNCPFTEIQLEQ